MATSALTAAKVLDAVAAKYPGAVLLRELVIADPAHNDLVDEWHAAHTVIAAAPFPTGAVRRIDGLLLEGGTQRTAIEVKVSHSDFLRETPEKRGPWERVTDRFVYACPVGIIRPEEVPDHCGLWWVDDEGSVVVRSRARRNRAVEPLPHQLTVAVAYRLKRFETELRRHNRLSV